ncbi:hypothetical protein HZB07_02290 [Candidatus Saganbacteria bacterium]|nr:hypothetical protein [Candidatus Saganbacteria bacterium]
MLRDEILILLTKSPRRGFSLQEIANYVRAKKETTKVALFRLVKKKTLFKLGYGYYATSPSQIDYESLACQLVYPSYLSFEYALHLHSIISQEPTTLTLATPRRTKTMKLGEIILEYSHLKPALITGYELRQQAYVACAEKALLDTLYLVSLKRRSININEFDLKNISHQKLKSFLKLYPAATKKLVGSILSA